MKRLSETIEGVLFITILVFLSVYTYQRNLLWKSELLFWQDALVKSPSKARPHATIGTIYDFRGDMERAEQEYITAIRLNPRHLFPYGPLAIVYGNRGEVDKAIEILLWLIENGWGHDHKAHTILGVMYGKKGLLYEAETELKEALRIHPDYGLARYHLAELLRNTGRRREAMEQYTRFFETVLPEERELIEKAKAGVGRL